MDGAAYQNYRNEGPAEIWARSSRQGQQGTSARPRSLKIDSTRDCIARLHHSSWWPSIVFSIAHFIRALRAEPTGIPTALHRSGLKAHLGSCLRRERKI